MKRSTTLRPGQWTGVVAVLALVAAVPASFAQQGSPPGGGPPGGRPGGFGPGGPGRMGQPVRMPELNAATVPVRALERALGLSDDQKTKLRALAFTLMEDKRDAQPLPPDMMGSGGGGPGGGGPPARAAMQQYQEQMRAAGEKMGALDAKASRDIEALLTADQKRKLPDVIAEATLLRDVGLPAEATGDLGLTADQKEKLKAIAAEGMPRPGGPGGPGGFGPGGGGPGQPPRPGGPPVGGPPPPDGGPGGPPPAGGAFGQFRRMQDERMERVMDVLDERQRAKARDYLRRYRRPMMGGGMMMGPGMMGPGGGPGGGRPGFGPGPGGPGQPPPPPGRGV